MKMDLNDTGILLIVRIDTKERLENAIAITDFLVKHFNAPIQDVYTDDPQSPGDALIKNEIL